MSFKIKIKPSFFVLAAFSILLKAEKYFAAVFILLFLHELCHIFTAGLWGLKTNGLTVSPIGLYADISGLERLHIAKRSAVAAAGPLFNLFLCLFCKGMVCNINLVLALFNLLPIYPLDGGKLFHYAVSYFTGVLRGNIISVKLGVLLSLLIIAAGTALLILCPPNISLLCLGIYLYRYNRTCIAGLTYTFYKTIVNKQDDRIMPLRCISASENMDIKAIVYRLSWDHCTLVYIRNTDITAVTEEKLLEYITQNGLRGKLKDVV